MCAALAVGEGAWLTSGVAPRCPRRRRAPGAALPTCSPTLNALGRCVETLYNHPARSLVNLSTALAMHPHRSSAGSRSARWQRASSSSKTSPIREASPAKARVEVACAKALYARKGSWRTSSWRDQGERDEAGARRRPLRIFATTSLDHPLEPTLAVHRATGHSRDEVTRLASSTRRRSTRPPVVGRFDKPRPPLLEGRVEAHADKRMSPRLSGQARWRNAVPRRPRPGVGSSCAYHRPRCPRLARRH